MAITELTKIAVATLRNQKEGQRAKLFAEREQRLADVVSIDAEIEALDATIAALAKDVAAPTVIAAL